MGQLTLTRLQPLTRSWDDSRTLYEEAFPKEERLPFWLLYLQSLRPFCDFYAYYDGQDLAGLTYVLTNDSYAFVFYLAVNAQVRGKGYGGQLLRILKKCYHEKEIILNIEPLDDNADNSNQRQKRLNFYEKHGFKLTDYQLEQAGQLYLVLSQSGQINKGKYLDLFNHFALGLIKVQLFPTTN